MRFEHIDLDFSKEGYAKATEMLRVAATLIGDGEGGEYGTNPEYERGIVELICDCCGIPMDLKDQVLAEIESIANAYAEPPEDDDFEPDFDDGICDFADPGGKSALRRATPSNPRNLPCPTCGKANRLTPADRALGYCCDECADLSERGGY